MYFHILSLSIVRFKSFIINLVQEKFVRSIYCFYLGSLSVVSVLPTLSTITAAYDLFTALIKIRIRQHAVSEFNLHQNNTTFDHPNMASHVWPLKTMPAIHDPCFEPVRGIFRANRPYCVSSDCPATTDLVTNIWNPL